MTVLFLFHSSPNYFSLFPLFFSFVYVSISLHQVSSYFLFIFYSPVLIFFLFFPTASLKCKVVYFFSFVRILLGLWFAILSSIVFFSYFHWLHLSSHSPSISSSSFCFTPFLSSFCPSSCFFPFFPSSHFQFHFLTTLFLSFFPFSYPFHFPTFFSPFSFFLFFFSPFKTTRFKNDSLEVHKSLCKCFTPLFAVLVGHGRSEGERVQISSFSIYVADVLKHIDEVLLNNAGLPIFLFGHSMASTFILFIVDYL